MNYLITFVCYGCHLHGDESGSVDRLHHMPRSPLIEPDQKRVSTEKRQMDQPPYGMDGCRREAVLAAMVERCSERSWTLRAAHVRSNHVHLAIDAGIRPDKVMNDLKAYASRCLNQLRLDEPARKRWARHGSTRWLWNQRSVSDAIQYVVSRQGAPMSVFEAAQI